MGAKDQYYEIDNHHLCLALLLEDVKDIAVTVVADLRKLDNEHFCNVLDDRGWMHPFDANGKRKASALKEAVADLTL